MLFFFFFLLPDEGKKKKNAESFVAKFSNGLDDASKG